ncbi:hypothetical protein D3C85_1873540 [compost metagenome]
MILLTSKKESSLPQGKTIEELKKDYDTALANFQELEASGTDEDKEAAYNVLEAAQNALEEAEKVD